MTSNQPLNYQKLVVVAHSTGLYAFIDGNTTCLNITQDEWQQVKQAFEAGQTTFRHIEIGDDYYRLANKVLVDRQGRLRQWPTEVSP